MAQVEFVSYDGEYPCRCFGTLVVRIEGVVFTLVNRLVSGGSVWFDDDWSEHVEEGEWGLSELPEEIEPFRQQILDLVNENVPFGCCGGCV